MSKLKLRLLALLMLVSLFSYSSQNSAAQETPPFTLKVVNPLNPLYGAAFYYQTDDDLVIYDVMRVVNLDPIRSITITLEEKIQGKNGWIAFSNNPVTLAPNSMEDIIFSVTIPDGVCEGIYTGLVNGTLTDYDGINTGSGLSTNLAIATEMIFDIQSGYICPTPQDLPGLNSTPTFVAPPTIVAKVLAQTPVVGGGGGGSSGDYTPLAPIESLPLETFNIIQDPENPFVVNEVFNDLPAPETPVNDDTVPDTVNVPEGTQTLNEIGDPVAPETIVEELLDRLEELVEPIVEEPIPEPVQTDVLITALPEKRLGDYSTQGRLIFYEKSQLRVQYAYQVPLDRAGKAVLEDLDLMTGTYHVSFKGLSHLTRFLEDVVITDETETLELDFSKNAQSFLLAGDNQYKFDDFVNSLDLATTTGSMLTTNELSDFNKDGMVNALDYAIQMFNIYKEGEKIPNQPIE